VHTIFVFRGRADLAAIIGFVEARIRTVAAGQVLSDLIGWYLAIAHPPGFAKGSIVGTWLEARLALVRAVPEETAVELADKLSDARAILWFDSMCHHRKGQSRPMITTYTISRCPTPTTDFTLRRRTVEAPFERL
jgi:hypothetical protein